MADGTPTHRSISGRVLPTAKLPERSPEDRGLIRNGPAIVGAGGSAPRAVPSSHGGVREDRANTRSLDTASNGARGANSGFPGD
jgi:hypothetical protein